MLKKIGIFVVALLLLIVVSVWAYLNYVKPTYEGKKQIEHLSQKVEVYFDDYGIPHILAQNDTDAMVALGYVHAQERLFQMEIIHRIASGKLSELFGEKLVETDKFFLTLGIDQNAEAVLQTLDTTSIAYKQALAYLDGVNQYVDKGKTPVEFRILGIKKHHYTIKDILNVYGYMSFGFAMAHRTDPLVSALEQKLGHDYVQQLGLNIPNNYTSIKTFSEREAVLVSKSTAALMQKNPIPSFVGSNAWVLGGEKTQSGKVIFENDPHIGFSQPAVWFQAHIKTPQTETYGFYLALTPYPLLAHNKKLAYGLTMFENDDIDLYVEKVNPQNKNEYLIDNHYQLFKKRSHTITVKGGESVTFEVLENHRGPILNSVLKEIKTQEPVSMYWVYLHRPQRFLELTYTMSRAQNLAQFTQSLPLLHAPGLNIMYGDAEGNIAWWAAGHLYSRLNNAPTKLMLDGTQSQNDSITYHPFSENPQAVNPNWHYVYSCNNQPDTLLSKRTIPGYYLPQDRAKRVVKLLESKNDWTQTDVEKMTFDHTSSIYGDLATIVVQNIENQKLTDVEQKALHILKSWNGTATTNNVGISIFNQWAYEYYKAMLHDEMNTDIFNEIINTHLAKRMLEPLVKGEYPIWTDNIETTDKKETITDIQYLAFQKAVQKLSQQFGNQPDTWLWKNVVSVEHKHPFGEIKLLRKYFNVGPFATNGTNEVLDNQLFDWSDSATFDIKAGPSTRRIIDFSNVENAKAILPTGNSGNFMSPHYNDQADLYLHGKFVPMLLDEFHIKKQSTLLQLIPEK